MFDLMSSSGRTRALKSVEHDASDVLNALVSQGGAVMRAAGRGNTPAWLTAGGAVLAAGALYWLMRPATEEEVTRKPAAKRTANAGAKRPAARKRAATAKT
jgi:hypothetical protein